MRRVTVLFIVAAACNSGTQHATDATHDTIPPGCGDGVKMGTEACDGTDLGSATCGTALAPGWVGVVSCTAACQINVAGCSSPATTYNAETDSSKWSTFDTTTLFAGAKGFIGSAFDGRYMYFSPNSNAAGVTDGIVARYDTQGGFGSSGSWATFDVATVNSVAKGFQGAAFDGRYVYLIPYNNGIGYDGTIARYDTQATGGFGSSDSWSTFDIATVNPSAVGYVHAAFDGRYLYLAPHYNGAYHGNVARFDTQGGFTDPAAWTVFDMSTVNASAKGYLNATFDGRYIYFAPYYNNTTYSGLVSRFDTQGGFTDAASWSMFDMRSLNPDAVGFYTTVFDGQYVYFAQYYDGIAMTPVYSGLAVRYDTHQTFGTAGSWSLFDVSTVNANAKGFIGATFDGRYVYLVPFYDGTDYDGVVPRYDTQGTGFTVAGSWTTFDTSTVTAGARGFQGAGFDGQYVYLVPSHNAAATPLGKITRFNAKSPSWLPRAWNAAFN